eukprot:c45740_g1_i1 orf=1-219(-)
MGEGEQAMSCFEGMEREDLSPDVVTSFCILKTCGDIRLADRGETIHDEIVKYGLLGVNVELGIFPWWICMPGV